MALDGSPWHVHQLSHALSQPCVGQSRIRERPCLVELRLQQGGLRVEHFRIGRDTHAEAFADDTECLLSRTNAVGGRDDGGEA